MKNVAIKNMDEETWRTIKSEAAKKGKSIPEFLAEAVYIAVAVREEVEREKNNSKK
uniref:Uncharacterized protein n=1 Tax=viral metagenome TaxID=1070528 RepID=A0A6M3JG51_9ZZZZ